MACKRIIRDAMPDSYDDIWELAEFCAREAALLRSLLEWLKLHPDSPERENKIQNWRQEVGLQLGNPEVDDRAKTLLGTLRGVPPESRRQIVRETLRMAHSEYFGSP